jgi:hypothetical protein
MTAILVRFERHGGCPGSGTGPWYTVQSSPPNDRSVQQGHVGELYPALVRFGRWDEILAEPEPNSKLTGLTGAYLFAKATALAAKGRVDQAKVQLAELEKLAAVEADAGLNRLKDVLTVATIIPRPALSWPKTKKTRPSPCSVRQWRKRTGWPTPNRPTGSSPPVIYRAGY